jgi:hypothetical protein
MTRTVDALVAAAPRSILGHAGLIGCPHGCQSCHRGDTADRGSDAVLPAWRSRAPTSG